MSSVGNGKRGRFHGVTVFTLDYESPDVIGEKSPGYIGLHISRDRGSIYLEMTVDAAAELARQLQIVVAAS
jgi:hypothetical protein